MFQPRRSGGWSWDCHDARVWGIKSYQEREEMKEHILISSGPGSRQFLLFIAALWLYSALKLFTGDKWYSAPSINFPISPQIYQISPPTLPTSPRIWVSNYKQIIMNESGWVTWHNRWHYGIILPPSFHFLTKNSDFILHCAHTLPLLRDKLSRKLRPERNE